MEAFFLDGHTPAIRCHPCKFFAARTPCDANRVLPNLRHAGSAHGPARPTASHQQGALCVSRSVRFHTDILVPFRKQGSILRLTLLGFRENPREGVGGSRAFGEDEMLEYLAYALLALVMIGCLLYVTMSPEAEDPPNPNRPDAKK